MSIFLQFSLTTFQFYRQNQFCIDQSSSLFVNICKIKLPSIHFIIVYTHVFYTFIVLEFILLICYHFGADYIRIVPRFIDISPKNNVFWSHARAMLCVLGRVSLAHRTVCSHITCAVVHERLRSLRPSLLDFHGFCSEANGDFGLHCRRVNKINPLFSLCCSRLQLGFIFQYMYSKKIRIFIY